MQDRATFAALRRSRRRVRHGALTVVLVDADRLTSPPKTPRRVAFSVSRRVGNAVTRNLVRRRLRAILTEGLQTGALAMPPGAYLIITGPSVATLSFGELKQNVEEALQQIESGPARSGSARHG